MEHKCAPRHRGAVNGRGQTNPKRVLAWLVVVVLPCFGLVRPPASAQASLDWRAPAECPSAAQAAAEIGKLVHRDPTGTPGLITTRVEITRLSSRQLLARVAVQSGTRVREHVLRDASCLALTRAAALIVALAIDPAAAPAEDAAGSDWRNGAGRATTQRSTPIPSAIDAPSATAASGAGNAQGAEAVGGSAPSRPAFDAPPTPPSFPRAAELGDNARPFASDANGTAAVVTTALSPRLERATAAEPRIASQSFVRRADQAEPTTEPSEMTATAGAARSAPARLGVSLGVAGGLAVGLLPQLAPSVAVSVGVTYADVYAGLRVGFAPKQRAQLVAPPGAGGTVALASVALEAGALVHALGLEFPLFAGMESGLFVARGVGVPEVDTRLHDWWATYAGTGASMSWAGRLRLGLRLEGLLALRRPRFALDLRSLEPSVFHRPSPLGARIWLGVAVVFQ